MYRQAVAVIYLGFNQWTTTRDPVLAIVVAKSRSGILPQRERESDNKKRQTENSTEQKSSVMALIGFTCLSEGYVSVRHSFCIHALLAEKQHDVGRDYFAHYILEITQRRRIVSESLCAVQKLAGAFRRWEFSNRFSLFFFLSSPYCFINLTTGKGLLGQDYCYLPASTILSHSCSTVRPLLGTRNYFSGRNVG